MGRVQHGAPTQTHRQSQPWGWHQPHKSQITSAVFTENIARPVATHFCMHGWGCGYETAPLQCRKSTKTTWNSPTVGLVMDCVQTLVIFLLFAARDFRRGWVLSGACWIFGVLAWMLSSNINARNPWLHLQKTTGDLEPLVSLFRTWKYLLEPKG